MKQPISLLITITLVILSGTPVCAGAADESRPIAQGMNDFYMSTVLPALKEVKKAMPPAPAGWTVAGESKIDPLPQSTGATQPYRFTYQIQYRRVAGIKEEENKLTEVFTESSERHGEEVNALINDLLKHQTETSLALRKATRRRNQKEMQRLNDELDENGRKMSAIHEDVDKRISHDVDSYLIKDAEAVITIIVNDEWVEALNGDPIPVPDAAFAFRWKGERKGPMLWQEGRTVILYGDWQQVGKGVFRGRVLHTPLNAKVQTIKMTITGDKNRAGELLKQMDRKAILSLMK